MWIGQETPCFFLHPCLDIFGSRWSLKNNLKVYVHLNMVSWFRVKKICGMFLCIMTFWRDILFHSCCKGWLFPQFPMIVAAFSHEIITPEFGQQPSLAVDGGQMLFMPYLWCDELLCPDAWWRAQAATLNKHIFKWMLGETTISYINIWNHPIETTIYKKMFQVPGKQPHAALWWQLCAF